MKDEAAHAAEIEVALRYAAWALHTAAGRQHVRRGVLFKAPGKADPEHLVAHAQAFSLQGAKAFRIDPEHLRRREGFALTDVGTNLVGALDQANYCIWCHAQGKDSCSRGLKEKPSPAAPAKVTFKKSVFGVTLAGCPLEEKISEFQQLKAAGIPVGALAVICIDNPMAAATGHRICNDCMKSCIYQKQDPVDIPQVETRTLKDVLGLPWGFEIYGLLTRWNPLNLRSPVPRPRTGRRVLVVGMGPAGFSLAHHLMNEGHTVVGVDGLKIEPLPEHLSGVRADGARVPFAPIRDAMEPVRVARRARDGRLWRRGGVRHHGALEQELSQARPPADRAPRRVRAVRRRPLRRHDHAGGRVRHGGHGGLRLRPRRAVHGRRQADHARHSQRPGAWRAHRVGLPDGAATHRRGAARFDRQHAGAPAGRRHRRRPDRDRHRDRIARLLRRPGREVSRPLPETRRGHGRGRHSRQVERRGARDRRGIPVARTRHSPRTPGSRARGSRRPHRGASRPLGRRNHRVPAPA